MLLLLQFTVVPDEKFCRVNVDATGNSIGGGNELLCKVIVAMVEQMMEEPEMM
jgi:hypothetical protein